MRDRSPEESSAHFPASPGAPTQAVPAPQLLPWQQTCPSEPQGPASEPAGEEQLASASAATAPRIGAMRIRSVPFESPAGGRV